MQLFYNQHINEETKQIYFDKEESRHIIRVLRKKIGDTLYVTNGCGFLFTTEIISEDEKKCISSIQNIEKKEKLHDYHLHLVVAPTKLNERYEWLVEKATEIGVDEITPIICEHSERERVNLERLEKIIISAMKQSLRFHKPLLNNSISFSDFMKKEIMGQKYIAHCEKDAKRELSAEIQEVIGEKITILIGPEGDFSSSEIEKALLNKFTPISLGEARLRTETAALFACNTLGVLFQKEKLKNS